MEYDDLLAFHQAYYHPSNCWFLTYGDLNFVDHLGFISEYAIKDFEKSELADNSELLLEYPMKKSADKLSNFAPDLMTPEDV